MTFILMKLWWTWRSQVEPIRDITASTIYASKKMHDFDYDNHFVIGVKE